MLRFAIITLAALFPICAFIKAMDMDQRNPTALPWWTAPILATVLIVLVRQWAAGSRRAAQKRSRLQHGQDLSGDDDDRSWLLFG